jgi:hypothetical protein
MTERVLICDRGKLRFTWNVVSRQAELYEMDGDRPVKRVAWLLMEDDGHVIDFTQEAFEQKCDDFLRAIADAPIVDATDEGEEKS